MYRKCDLVDVSTHSRLKAAVDKEQYQISDQLVSTHSRLKAAERSKTDKQDARLFQHTAA